MRYLCLILYYGVFRWLPSSYSKLSLGLGRVSMILRRWACSHIFEYCGKKVNIERGATFGAGKHIRIGNESGIGINCKVPSNIHIGNNVMMGPNCVIFNNNHGFDRIDIPMQKQGFTPVKPVIIEDDCWIGCNVIMTAGRIVKKGSIVGAGCVLTKDFPEYSIIGGNPSRLIRNRKTNTI